MIDSGFGTVFEIALHLAPGRGKTSAAMQMHHATKVPRRRRAGDIRIPEMICSRMIHRFAFAERNWKSTMAINVSVEPEYPVSVVYRSVERQGDDKRGNSQHLRARRDGLDAY